MCRGVAAGLRGEAGRPRDVVLRARTFKNPSSCIMGDDQLHRLADRPIRILHRRIQVQAFAPEVDLVKGLSRFIEWFNTQGIAQRVCTQEAALPNW